ncbi:unnamed protein product, partial [Brachionus calyciflorus]
MKRFLFLVFVFINFAGKCFPITNDQIIENCKNIKLFYQKVDHFNYDSNQQDYFQQRYIIFDKYFKGKGSPIMFCTGYEADIVDLCHENFFAWQLSEKHGALVVFAEHRYFGESLPFGNNSHKYPFHKYLNVDQTLKDYANVIKSIKSKTPNAENSPVIAFGGSYGGMLAAWIRIKYPHLVEGSLASSAPVSQTNCYDYARIVTDIMRNSSKNCPNVINKLWKIIDNISKSEDGLKKLTNYFKLCNQINSGEIANFKQILVNAIFFLVQSNYNFETNIVTPLPALPVKAFCDRIINSLKDDDLENEENVLNAISNGYQVFFNYTGQTKCLPLEKMLMQNRDALSMEILGCNGKFFTFCTNGKTDIFEEKHFVFEDFFNSCKNKFNLSPVENLFRTYYPFIHDDHRSFSNIIFSNGLWDPYWTSGIYEYVNDEIKIILIENAAHHADLLEPNKNDPESLKKARIDEEKIILKWIEDYNKINPIN